MFDTPDLLVGGLRRRRLIAVQSNIDILRLVAILLDPLSHENAKVGKVGELAKVHNKVLVVGVFEGVNNQCDNERVSSE